MILGRTSLPNETISSALRTHCPLLSSLPNHGSHHRPPPRTDSAHFPANPSILPRNYLAFVSCASCSRLPTMVRRGSRAVPAKPVETRGTSVRVTVRIRKFESTCREGREGDGVAVLSSCLICGSIASADAVGKYANVPSLQSRFCHYVLHRLPLRQIYRCHILATPSVQLSKIS